MSAVERAAEIAKWYTDHGEHRLIAQALAAADPPLLVTEELTAEMERMRRWIAEATIVLNDWEDVWRAAGSPGPLGKSKALATRDRVITPQVQAVLDVAVALNGTLLEQEVWNLVRDLDDAVDAYLASRSS